VIEHYFDDDEVLFFEPGSALSLAGAIATCVRDPAAALARAQRAGERLDAISWSRQRSSYLELVDGLCRAQDAA
jgi:hypothetical protein